MAGDPKETQLRIYIYVSIDTHTYDVTGQIQPAPPFSVDRLEWNRILSLKSLLPVL